MLKRLAAGMLLSAAIISVTMIGQVVAVPVYLASWGTQVYGEWLTLTNLVTSLSILNLGVQSHVSNRLIALYVRGNLAEGTRLLHAALRLYIVVCGVALTIVLLLCSWPEFSHSLGVKAIASNHARVIIALQGSLAVYAIVGGLLLSLFRVTNQLPRQLGYSLVERMLFIGAPCCAALLGATPLQATAMMTLIIGILAIIELRDVSRRSPFPIGISDSSWRASGSLIAPSFLFLAVTLSAQLLSTGIVLIVSRNAGAVAVAVFSTTLMLTNFIRIVIGQGMNVVWPEITSAAARESYERVIRWHRLIWKLAFALALLSSAGIYLIGNDVLSMWTRGRIPPDASLNLLLSLYLVIQTPALISGAFGLAMNRQMGVFKVQILTAVSSLLIAAFLTPRWGVSGTAAALVLGQLGGTIYITKTVCSWTRDTLSAVIETNVLRMLPIIGLTLLLAASASAAGLPIRLLVCGVLIPVSLAAGWRTCLTSDEREFVKLRLRFHRRETVLV